MSHPFDLTGKVAIITGASRGIGEAVARAYAAAGASLVLSSRKLENITAVVDAINAEYPGRAVAVAAHAGERASAAKLVEAAVAHFGRVDIAVNNAATNPHFGPLLTSDESHWDKIYEVNVKGYFWVCQAAAQQMYAQGTGGKLINVASVLGLTPGYLMGIYSISKAAVIMLTRQLAAELAPANIQVNAIAPGFIKTKFSSAIWANPQMNERVIASIPAGRMAEPEELTGVMLYLASSASDYTTGSVYSVDGGMLSHSA